MLNSRQRLMRTSPRWIRTNHTFHQVTSCRQLVLRVWFGFSGPSWTEAVTSPSYDIETSYSLMCWKANDESFLLVRVLAPEDSWIILCDHGKVLHHQFWAVTVLISCRALSPGWGRPYLRTSPSSYKLSSRRMRVFVFCFVLVFYREFIEKLTLIRCNYGDSSFTVI
jgi:hypothetical protein